MKKIFTSFCFSLFTLISISQINCVINSPSTISGHINFNFTQWSNMVDLSVPVNSVTGDVAIVDDGTTAGSEGCNPLVNGAAINGKIALVFRGSCEFGDKALHAQNQGALAVLIVNNQPGTISMTEGTNGGSVTIPVLMIEETDGVTIQNEISNGNTVNMYLGSPFGIYNNDLGLSIEKSVLPNEASIQKDVADGNPNNFSITPKAWITNFGNNNQSGITLTATITFNGNTIYSNTSSPISINSFDSAYVSLPTFSQPSYTPGHYLLEYEVSSGVSDEHIPNDTVASTFYISDGNYSKSRIDTVTNQPIATTFLRPGSSIDPFFSSCIYFEKENLNNQYLGKVQLALESEQGTSLNGEYVESKVYEWNDAFSDPMNATFNNITQVGTGNYVYQADLQGDFITVDLDQPVLLNSNQKYLVCAEIYDEDLYLGFDDYLDYTTTFEEQQKIITTLESDGIYYRHGIGLSAIPAIIMNTVQIDFDFSYTSSSVCQNNSVLSPTITGVTNGTFSATPAGLSINANTGEITPSTSSPGTYTIEYTVTANGITVIKDQSITIVQQEDPSFSYPSQLCAASSSIVNPTITGQSGGTFTATPGGLDINTNSGDIIPSNSTLGSYDVTYTTSTNLCASSETMTIEVVNTESSTFTYDQSQYCKDDGLIMPQISGSTGGSFSANNGLSINTDGSFNTTNNSTGTYTITYTSSTTSCATSTDVTIEILEEEDASFVYPNNYYCIGESNAISPSISGLQSGTFTASPSGLNLDANTGAFTPANATPDIYTVTYTSSNNVCANTENYTIEINECLSVSNAKTANFSFYPNPTKGMIYLVSTINASDAVVEIMDLQGKIISSKQMNIDIGTQYDFNLSQLERGVYFIKVATGKNTTVKRVIVQR